MSVGYLLVAGGALNIPYVIFVIIDNYSYIAWCGGKPRDNTGFVGRYGRGAIVTFEASKVTKNACQQRGFFAAQAMPCLSFSYGGQSAQAGKTGAATFCPASLAIGLASAKIAMPCSRTGPLLFSPLLAEAFLLT